MSSLIWKFKNSQVVIGGDFNSIILDEKKGGIQHLFRSSLEFKAWIEEQGLIGIPLRMTHSHGITEDRVLIS